MTDDDLIQEEGVYITPSRVSLIKAVEKQDDVIPYRRLSNISIEEYERRLKNKIQGAEQEQLMPPNCRFYTQFGTEKIIVIEDPPAVRTIRLRTNLDVELAKLEREGKLDEYGYRDYLKKHPFAPWKFTLSFPYIVYVLDFIKDGMGIDIFRAMKVFFRTKPLSSLNDSLLYPAFNNVNNDCTMCIRSVEAVAESPSKLNLDESITEKVLGILERVWRYEFNNDYNYCNQIHEPVPGLGTIFEWEYNTNKDPMFVFSVNWYSHEQSLKEVIDTWRYRNDKEPEDKIFHALRDPCVSFFEKRDDIRKRDEIYSNYSQQIDLSYIEQKLEGDTTKRPYYSDDDDDRRVSYPKGAKIFSVGDEIIFKKKKYWIEGIKVKYKPSKEDGEEVLILEGENSEKEEVKLGKQTIKQLFKPNEKDLEEIQTVRGPVKVGDLIVISDPIKFINKVSSVRISRDGKPEATMGDGNYLLNNIKFTKVDSDDFDRFGTRIKKGETYFIEEDYCGTRTKIGYIGNYNGIDDSSRMIFETHSYGLKKVKINNTSKEICQISPASRKENVMVCGTNLLFSPVGIIIEKDRILRSINEDMDSKLTANRTKFNEYVSRIVDIDKHVNIPGFDRDISFSVGDKVIVADWNIPNRMKNISTIRSIGIIEKNNCPLKLVLLLENLEETFTVTLVNFSSGTVYNGLVRKVTEEWNGLRVGMFIDPKKKIPGFKKTKRSKIWAILTDTNCNIPLFLCSNYGSLWPTEKNLSLFEFGNTRKKVAETIFDPKSFKPQVFDNLIARSYGSGYSRTTFRHYIVTGFRATDMFSHHDFTLDTEYDSSDFSLVESSCKKFRNTFTWKYGIPAQRNLFNMEYMNGSKLLFPDLYGFYLNGEEKLRDLVLPEEVKEVREEELEEEVDEETELEEATELVEGEEDV